MRAEPKRATASLGICYPFTAPDQCPDTGLTHYTRAAHGRALNGLPAVANASPPVVVMGRVVHNQTGGPRRGA